MRHIANRRVLLTLLAGLLLMIPAPTAFAQEPELPDAAARACLVVPNLIAHEALISNLDVCRPPT